MRRDCRGALSSSVENFFTDMFAPMGIGPRAISSRRSRAEFIAKYQANEYADSLRDAGHRNVRVGRVSSGKWAVTYKV